MIKSHLMFITNYSLYIILLSMSLILIMNMNNHPIMIMIILLIYNCLICLNMSLWKLNYILSIFLFLMMISGLLVIFLYFSSLISNEQFKFKFNLLMAIFYLTNLITLCFILNLYHPSWTWNLLIYKYKFHENSSIFNINKMTFNNILSLYEYPFNNLTSLCMFYLLFSLFVIIKICSSKSISLRKIN